jgi:hypothetical protein
MNNQRRCSCCRSIDHDIRTCPQYIDEIDENLIINFTENGNNAVFPLTMSRPIIYKLGDKYGLDRNLNHNYYLERLILIYLHLGEQRRQERRDRRNAENQRRLMEEQILRQRNLPTLVIQDNTDTPVAQVIVPFPLMAQPGRFQNILSIQDLNALRNSFQQLSMEIESEIVAREEETAPKFVFDPTKFTDENIQCDCPVCYETAPSVLTNCNHTYCHGCIVKMINHRNNQVSCALCREKVTTVYLQNME